jgi:hypothetical protein
MTYTKGTVKGKYTPMHPEKYRGDITQIIFRSSYERVLMRWADLNPNILQWASEEVIVPYVSPLDNQEHRYFLDFWLKIKTKDGTIKTMIVEVKPEKYTVEPKIPKRKTRGYISEVKQWVVNSAKWDAARKFAANNKMEFVIVTERDLGLMTYPA